jgi:aspartate/glutamate racemase
MDGPVYREALSSLGIETMVPEQHDFDTVDRIIFSELVNGLVTDASQRAYNDVIARLRDRGCDAVALAGALGEAIDAGLGKRRYP